VGRDIWQKTIAHHESQSSVILFFIEGVDFRNDGDGRGIGWVLFQWIPSVEAKVQLDRV